MRGRDGADQVYRGLPRDAEAVVAMPADRVAEAKKTLLDGKGLLAEVRGMSPNPTRKDVVRLINRRSSHLFARLPTSFKRLMYA